MEKFHSNAKKDYFGKRVKVVKRYLADTIYVGKTGTITKNYPKTWQFEVLFDSKYKDELKDAYGLKVLFPLDYLEII